MHVGHRSMSCVAGFGVSMYSRSADASVSPARGWQRSRSKHVCSVHLPLSGGGAWADREVVEGERERRVDGHRRAAVCLKRVALARRRRQRHEDLKRLERRPRFVAVDVDRDAVAKRAALGLRALAAAPIALDLAPAVAW